MEGHLARKHYRCPPRRANFKTGSSWYGNEIYLKAHGRWCHLHRAVDRSGALVDATFSERRDLTAARAFLRSAKAAVGIVPDRVTTDGHDSDPRTIRAELGKQVQHRPIRTLDNKLEQDHRGIKGRDRPRHFLRPRSRHNQHVPAHSRRRRFLRRA